MDRNAVNALDTSSIALPEALFEPEAGLHIRLEMRDRIVFKAYYPRYAAKAREKFEREIEAFRFFTARRAPFVPELLESGITNEICGLALRNGGVTLANWLEKAPHSAFDGILDQLLRIDAWLYRHRVNYLQASPKDVLVDDAGTARIIDFEYTFLNEPFEQILVERMDHDRLESLPPDLAETVRARVHARKTESRHFFYRVLRNGVMRRLGQSRVQKNVQRTL
ncbi:MAG: hypothetical protein J4G10_05540 [Alphaproteobacteria bacterium]|nr:hypothetical protein [Alphaproteobacteria bacterium]